MLPKIHYNNVVTCDPDMLERLHTVALKFLMSTMLSPRQPHDSSHLNTSSSARSLQLQLSSWQAGPWCWLRPPAMLSQCSIALEYGTQWLIHSLAASGRSLLGWRSHLGGSCLGCICLYASALQSLSSVRYLSTHRSTFQLSESHEHGTA